MDIRRSIRPLDYALTAVLAALAAFIGVENVNAGPHADVAHALDSHSALIVPVFVLTTLPLLARRHNVLAALGVSLGVMAADVVAFGWIVRCGFGLPLTFAFAYAVARYAGHRQNQVIGLVGVLALQTVTLVQDSATDGLGALGVSLPLSAVAYGIGLFVQNRLGRTADGPTLHAERAVHAQV